MAHRDVLLFEHGTVPRQSVEESLAGDMSRTLALAQLIRDKLARQAFPVGDAELAEEYGAIVWLPEAGQSAPRRLAVEPVAGEPFAWSVRVEEMPGCLGLFMRHRTSAQAFTNIRRALDAVLEAHPYEFRNARWVDQSEVPPS